MCHQMRPSLVQIMACRLDGAKPLSEQIMEYCSLDHKEQTFKSEIFIKNLYIFIQENAFVNVIWKMATILSRPQCVNTKS